jgi:hypothetical protein
MRKLSLIKKFKVVIVFNTYAEKRAYFSYTCPIPPKQTLRCRKSGKQAFEGAVY